MVFPLENLSKHYGGGGEVNVSYLNNKGIVVQTLQKTTTIILA